LGLDNGVTIDFSNDNFQYNFILTPRYIIAGIRAESPAARAGVKVGDQLLKVNGKEAKKLSLAKITEKMQTNPGDELRLELQRDNETIKVRFKLIDPIPIE
jgi:C-terminal processing protease CtpA/Prc